MKPDGFEYEYKGVEPMSTGILLTKLQHKSKHFFRTVKS